MQDIIFEILREEKIKRAKNVHSRLMLAFCIKEMLAVYEINASTEEVYRAIREYERCDGYEK